MSYFLTQSDALRFLALNVSYQNAEAISKSDTVDLPHTASAIYVGVAGNITVDLEGIGTGILLKSVPVGITKLKITRVYSAGTAATDMVALW